MSDELRRLAKQAIIKTIAEEGQPGILGRSDGVLFFTDAAGVVHQDRVWARVGGGDSPSEAVVRIISTPRQLNLPVIIGIRNGQPTVIRGDTERAVVLTGGRPFANVAEHASSHGRTANDPLYIAGPAFLPLMAVPSNPLAMTVTVQQGFYRYQGTEKVFTTTTGASLAAHVPASQNQQKFVVLSLDRSTNALTVTAGTTVSSLFGAIPFDAAAVLAIVDDLNDAHYPIAAIRFYYGQTRITAADIFMDLRLWGGEALQGSEALQTVDLMVVFDDDFVFFNEEPVLWL